MTERESELEQLVIETALRGGVCPLTIARADGLCAQLFTKYQKCDLCWQQYLNGEIPKFTYGIYTIQHRYGTDHFKKQYSFWVVERGFKEYLRKDLHWWSFDGKCEFSTAEEALRTLQHYLQWSKYS